jgi:hypothetical protein
VALLQLSTLHTCSLLHHLACCLAACMPRLLPTYSRPSHLDLPTSPSLFLLTPSCCLLCCTLAACRCFPWLLLLLLLAAAAPVTRRSAASSIEPCCCLLAEQLAEPRYRLRSAIAASPLPRCLLRAEVAACTNARALPRHRCSSEPEPPLRRATASAPS